MHQGLRLADQCATALSPSSVATRFNKHTNLNQTSGTRRRSLLGPVQARIKPGNNGSWREQTDKVKFAYPGTGSANGSVPLCIVGRRLCNKPPAYGIQHWNNLTLLSCQKKGYV